MPEDTAPQDVPRLSVHSSDYLVSLLAETSQEDFAFYCLDCDFRFSFASLTMCRMFGLEPSELVGRSFLEVFCVSTPPIEKIVNRFVIPIATIGGQKQWVCILLFELPRNDNHVRFAGVIIRTTKTVLDEFDHIKERVDSLTSSERQVVELIFEGMQNKVVANRLGISERTVEERRSKAMGKLEVSSLAKLVQFWIKVHRLEAAKAHRNENALVKHDEILRMPQPFFSILAEAIDDELAFYSLDPGGRFVFLSRSAKKLIGLEPGEWIGRSIEDALARSQFNRQLTEVDSICGQSLASTQGECVFQSSSLAVRKVRYQQVRIVNQNQSFGFAGIFFQMSGIEVSESLIYEMRLADSLTKVEREVVEFVFEGKLNSMIASELCVAVRTVESRRARAMAKLKVKSLSQFVKLWSLLQNSMDVDR